MKINLYRSQCGARFTIGELTIDGDDWRCYTCEDIDRRLEIGGEKIPAQTCIPRGIYEVVISLSNRFKRPLPELLKVPHFTGIRIHPGNTAADTEGCILPGLEVGTFGVLQSRDAFAALYTRIAAAIDRGERVLIHVT